MYPESFLPLMLIDWCVCCCLTLVLWSFGMFMLKSLFPTTLNRKIEVIIMYSLSLMKFFSFNYHFHYVLWKNMMSERVLDTVTLWAKFAKEEERQNRRIVFSRVNEPTRMISFHMINACINDTQKNKNDDVQNCEQIFFRESFTQAFIIWNDIILIGSNEVTWMNNVAIQSILGWITFRLLPIKS